MKRKELKNLAQKIAKQEQILQNSNDSKEIAKAQNEIMKLSGCVESMDDMIIIDEIVQEILSKNS